ncbi:MAG: alpha/beta hydrolase fold domain-containing protein [Gammaproteobacteria bacterium]|nr:alpha/beta hydrolase fold domain-containing protein [Gammaproteobacteria bacterium]MCP5425643.1 alpha/beta hydrolase fold domain-containing protein [Gammaproteobacteria bacterium]MCP5458959.1 alpha/beta hydrolase fold domain-containing protein [Gammaproteobacteria bacterium]
MSAEFDTLEIDPKGPTRSTIIWLHGLGADAHDFEPIVPYLKVPEELGLRFVFPNAPIRPVTVNGGMAMRAWYDILGMDIPRVEDPNGVHDSEQRLLALIEREKERGVPADHIVLAGFSQGGAIALYTGLRYPERLAGLLALSCYIPLAATLADERHAANQDAPIFLAHGRYDEVIPIDYGRATGEQLEKLGYQPQRYEYPMGHEVNMEEIQAIGAWLRQVLSAAEN